MSLQLILNLVTGDVNFPSVTVVVEMDKINLFLEIVVNIGYFKSGKEEDKSFGKSSDHIKW